MIILLFSIKMEVIVYCRVSTEAQRKNLKEQIQKIRYFCKDRGYKILQVYEDVYSGMANNYQYLNLNKVIKNKCKTIIITHIDRLTRNPEVFEIILENGCI